MAVLLLTTPANIQTVIDRHEDAIDKHEKNAFGQSLQRQEVVLDTGDRMQDTVAGPLLDGGLSHQASSNSPSLHMASVIFSD